MLGWELSSLSKHCSAWLLCQALGQGGSLPRALPSRAALTSVHYRGEGVAHSQQREEDWGSEWGRLWFLNPQHPLCADTPAPAYLWPDLEEPRTSSINQLSAA